MQNDLASQVTLAQVKAGDYVRTTPTPRKGEPGLFLVDTENPRVSKGIARRVVQNVSEKNVGRFLVFHDATRTAPRNGTAMMWVYKLGADGKPLPEPVYPKCPTCGTDEPGCRTKDGAWAPNMHAPRAELIRRAAERPSQVSKGATKTATSTHRTDAEMNAVLASSEPVGEVCGVCRGYGVVRKRGKHAGGPYKTANGADAATANGNSEVCPVCVGKGERAA